MSRYAFSLQTKPRPKRPWLRASPALVFFLIIISVNLYLQLRFGWDPTATVMLIFFVFFYLIVVFFIYHSARRRELTQQILHIHLDKPILKPGETVTGYVNLKIDNRLWLYSTSARIWGGEHAEIVELHGETSSTYTDELPVINEELQLKPGGLAMPLPRNIKERKRISPGNYYYYFSIDIPSDALPSWSSSLACVRYFVRIRLNIPMCPDPIVEKDIWVMPEAQALKTIPKVYRSYCEKYDAGNPTLSIELRNAETTPGRALQGRITYLGPNGNKIRAVRLQLIERVWKRVRTLEKVFEKPIAELTLQPQGAGPSISIPFIMNVPQNAFPTVVGQICSIRYLIKAQADIAFAKDIEVIGEVFVVTPEA